MKIRKTRKLSMTDLAEKLEKYSISELKDIAKKEATKEVEKKIKPKFI